jgi:hypothetical protein
MNRLLSRGLAASMLVLAGLAVGARSAEAQGSVSITPYAGIFVPTRNSFSSLGNSIKRNNSFIGGGRLTFWGRGLFGAEFVAGYTPARIKVAGATINANRDSKVVVASLKLMVGVSPAVSGLGFYVGAGPAYIRRGEDILDSNKSKSDFGANVGVGVRLPLGSMIGLRFDAEDYMYGGNFSGSKSYQNDLALTAGLSVRF